MNNRAAGADTLIYENFTVDWTVHSFGAAEPQAMELKEEAEEKQADSADNDAAGSAGEGDAAEDTKPQKEISVMINGKPVRLTGKADYVFVDIFDFYDFDLKASAGRAIITKLNGSNAQYAAELKDGDEITLGWQELFRQKENEKENE